MINFEGRVAVVTGGGRGIGRATALALARRGAKVLVNDYGGALDTITPGTIEVAQSVVDEIRAAGGTAVADGTTVGTAEAATEIVNHTLSEFGQIDILVNNAGGADGFHGIDERTDEYVEGVIRSNLLGSVMLVRRVWPIMCKQRYGRIINTSSNTTLGMQGTLAYVSAKGGIIGLTNVAAIEGAPFGIVCNAVFPAAYTRGVEQQPPGTMDWFKPFTPELVAEGVTFLCSSENTATGELYRIGGGRFGRYSIHGNSGIHDAQLTAEIVAARIDEARNIDPTVALNNTLEDMSRFGDMPQLPS